MNYLSLGPDRFPLEGPEGLPITKPPYGRITAIDLNTGEHKWSVALGSGPRDHPRLKDLKLPPLGWPSRGFVFVTKTALFAVQEPATSVRLSDVTNALEFTAATRDARLYVFDKRTGQLLSELPLPSNAGGGVPAELVAIALDGK